MESIDALAKAIKEFEGGVVIVSHDFRTYLPFYVFFFLLHFGRTYPSSYLLLFTSGIGTNMRNLIPQV